MARLSVIVTLSCLFICRSARVRAARVSVDAQDMEGLSSSTPPLGVALFGLTGDGKSTLCNWLAGKEDVCQAGSALQSETTEVTVATLPWFNDESQGQLVLADTPGISDTEGRDAHQWIATVKNIKLGLPMLDAVILVVNFAQERMNQDRRDMISVLRDSFGYDLWKHFAVVFTHFPWKTETNRFGKSQASLDKKAVGWRGYFKGLEEERGIDSEDHDQEIDKLMQAIPFFAVEMDTEIAGIISSSNAPQEHVDSGLTEVLGLPQLTALRSWLVENHADNGALDLKKMRPRMGPGEVVPQQSFECFFPLSCGIHVAGKHLSSRDEVRIVPSSIECGDENAEGVVDTLEFATQRTAEPPETEAHFNLGEVLQDAPGDFRVCYCEYGKCDIPERFAQDAGVLHLRPVSCGIPKCPANVDQYGIDAGPLEPLDCVGGQAAEVSYPHHITFHCAEGYAVAGKREQLSFKTQCLSNGEFTPAKLGCERVQCGYPPPVTHAIPTTTEVVSFGEPAVYECEPSYTMTGGPTGGTDFGLKCKADGTFSQHSVLPQGCRRWDVGQWAACSVDCGTGSQTRDVACSTGDDEDCDASAKPPSTRECQWYTGCDGCTTPSDCKPVTVNQMLNATGLMPSMVSAVLPNVPTDRFSPVSSCMCTEQCYRNGVRMVESGTTTSQLKWSDPIHDTCFYDVVSKGCGCMHQQTRSGQTWKVIGGGMCSDMDGKILKGGLAIQNKRDEHDFVRGEPISLEGCKKACLELGQCPGIHYSASQTWIPVLRSPFTGESSCFVYSSASKDEREEYAQGLKKRYDVQVLEGSSGDIKGSSRATKQGGYWKMALDMHKWMFNDVLGGSNSDPEIPGHCYKFFK